MLKKIICYILAVLLLSAIIVGATFSYLASSSSGNENSVNSESKKFEVIYTGGTTINGPLKIGKQKEDGLNTTVNIKMAENSALATGTIYIDVEKITPNLAIEGFIWEVVGIQNNDQVYTNKGNFLNINDTDNSIVNVVENYPLTEENTSFTIYLWIDGNMVDNSVLNSEFIGYIGAKTENFTGTTVS